MVAAGGEHDEPDGVRLREKSYASTATTTEEEPGYAARLAVMDVSTSSSVSRGVVNVVDVVDEESPLVVDAPPTHLVADEKARPAQTRDEPVEPEESNPKPSRRSPPKVYHDWPTRVEYFACGILPVRKVGTLTVLFERTGRDGRPQRVVAGPYWHLLGLTSAVLLLVDVAVYGFVVPVTLTAARSVGLLLAALTLSILLATGLTEPGVCPRYVIALGKSWTYSEYAQAWRPPGTVYCKHCHLLITDYHHFCPWTGTAIGANNEMYFHALILMLCVSLTYDLILVFLVLNGDIA